MKKLTPRKFLVFLLMLALLVWVPLQTNLSHLRREHQLLVAEIPDCETELRPTMVFAESIDSFVQRYFVAIPPRQAAKVMIDIDDREIELATLQGGKYGHLAQLWVSVSPEKSGGDASQNQQPPAAFNSSISVLLEDLAPHAMAIQKSPTGKADRAQTFLSEQGPLRFKDSMRTGDRLESLELVAGTEGRVASRLWLEVSHAEVQD